MIDPQQELPKDDPRRLVDDNVRGKVSFILQFKAEPGVSAEVIADQLLKVYSALNEYCLAKYKTDLRIVRQDENESQMTVGFSE